MTQKSDSATCGLGEAWCLCEREEDHDGPHVCACGGSWGFDASGLFEYVRTPGSNPAYEQVLEP